MKVNRREELSRRQLLKRGMAVTAMFAVAPGQGEQRSNRTGTLQPQFRAPWNGGAYILEGNHGPAHRDHGGWDHTWALDIDLPCGTHVLAPADGVIDEAGTKDSPSGPGGRQLSIVHTGPTGKRFTSVFLHLEGMPRTSGPVRQGQPVALSGASCNGTERGLKPHLHFHLWSGRGDRSARTMPIETLLMERLGADVGYRVYNALGCDLEHGRLTDPQWGDLEYYSNADCESGGAIHKPCCFDGERPAHPAGTLVKTRADDTVYLLRGPDERLPVICRIRISGAEAWRNPYDQPTACGDQFVRSNVITISNAEMAKYPKGGILDRVRGLPGKGLRHPDGTLITAKAGELSIISNGMSLPLLTPAGRLHALRWRREASPRR